MELTEEIKEKLRKELLERIEHTRTKHSCFCDGIIISCNDVKEINIVENVWKKNEDLKNYSLEQKLCILETLALRITIKETGVFIEGFDDIIGYIRRGREVIPFSELLKKCSK